MQSTIHAFLSRHGLLKSGRCFLLAVSGGADSVAMLHAMAELAHAGRFRVVAAHLNHGIRGRQADADARFVQQLAAQLGVRCIVGNTDVPALARRRKLSLEMAAREARYAFLLRAARRVRADAIATAHTADDQAETVLLKLARGTGLRGLGGIAPVSTLEEFMLIRPMLGISRARIESYLGASRLAWREDASNRDTHFLRNRVRHEILPLLARRLNPRIRETLVRTAAILREDGEVLDSLARRWRVRHPVRSGLLPCRPLRRVPAAIRRRILIGWLTASGVPAAALDFEAVDRVEQLAAGTAGSRSVELTDGRRVMREYDGLRVAACTEILTSSYCHALKVPGITRVPGAGMEIEITIAPGLRKQKPAGPGVLPAEATLGCLQHSLTIRNWQAGDRIRPLGMGGSKKIQDILTDAKVPRSMRATIPVVVAGSEIVWLPGYRVAQGWGVEDPGLRGLHITVREYTG